MSVPMIVQTISDREASCRDRVPLRAAVPLNSRVVPIFDSGSGSHCVPYANFFPRSALTTMSRTHLHEELAHSRAAVTADTQYGPVTGRRAANGAAVFLGEDPPGSWVLSKRR